MSNASTLHAAYHGKPANKSHRKHADGTALCGAKAGYWTVLRLVDSGATCQRCRQLRNKGA